MTFKKLFKKVAAVLVAGATVVAMAVPAFAADPLFTSTLAENGKPTAPASDYTIDVAGKLGVKAEDITKVEASFTSTFTGDACFNGTVGGNVASTGKWANAGQIEYTEAGTNQVFAWDVPEGGMAAEDDGSVVVHVQLWWENAGTVTLDKVTVTTKDGKTYSTDAGTPAGGSETAGSSTGDSANVGLILAVAAAVVAVGATVVLKKRETVER